jgi:hypothetical protein
LWKDLGVILSPTNPAITTKPKSEENSLIPFPAIANHLLPFAEAAEKRYDRGGFWWELRACDYYDEFDKPKILWPEIANGVRFTLDKSGYYANNKVYLIPVADLYLLGLLNSSLIRLFINNVSTDLQANSFNFSAVFIERTPIHTLNSLDPQETARQGPAVTGVTAMQIIRLHSPKSKYHYTATNHS